MRIRSIKPEFWRSPDVSCLSIEDRLLFIGLWSYVDDNGVGIDDVAVIIGDLFAPDMFRQSRETVARVSEGLSNLSEGGQIVRYQVDGRGYLFVSNWEKHQRIDKPGKPRFPRPDGESALLATSSRDSRDTLAPGAGEQGSRGTEEQGGARERAASPFCSKHQPDGPNGESCRACGDARRALDAQQAKAKQKPTPLPPRIGDPIPDCNHKWLPNGTCNYCSERNEGAAA